MWAGMVLGALVVSAGCDGDPVGGTGARADADPANIGNSTPSSFLPQTSGGGGSASSSTGGGAGPVSDTGTQGDPAADPNAGGEGEASAVDAGAADAQPGREVIPICDDDADGGMPSGRTSDGERCAVAGDLVAQYRVGDSDPLDNQVRAQFNIQNHGTTSIPLTQLTLRYWYTKETTPPLQEFHCDYALIGAGLVSGSFSTSERDGVDHFMEVSFTGGTLAAGGETGEIQTRFNTEGWGEYDESDDYSYDGSATTYADSERITLYLSGALIWGAEP